MGTCLLCSFLLTLVWKIRERTFLKFFSTWFYGVGNILCPHAPSPRARAFSCLAVSSPALPCLLVPSRVFSCLAVSSRVIPCHSFAGFCSNFRVIFEQVWNILDYHVNHSDTSIHYSFILSCIESIFGMEVLRDDRHQPHTMLLW